MNCGSTNLTTDITVAVFLSDYELSPEKNPQGFNGIRDHNVGGRAAVLILLSYEDPYIWSRSIFWVYCSSVLEQVNFLSLLFVCFTFFSKRYGIFRRRAW